MREGAFVGGGSPQCGDAPGVESLRDEPNLLATEWLGPCGDNGGGVAVPPAAAGGSGRAAIEAGGEGAAATEDGENAHARQTLTFNWAGSSWLGNRQIVTTEASFELPRSLSLYVFARHDANGPMCAAPMDLRALRIHEKGRIVRDYVPAMKRDTKVCGLYEVCTGTFLVNAGTGSLLPPPGWREGLAITVVKDAAR